MFWRFSHEHLPYISEKPPYEPQNLPYVSEIGGIIKHFPALMSRRMNQTTKFAMLCMPSSPRTSLSTYVATIWSAIALFQCSDGRCMLVVKPSLCGLNCQPAAESVHDLHNGLEARVAVPVEALVKAFTSHTRLLRDLPHTLRFGHIADCGLQQRQIVKLGHRIEVRDGRPPRSRDARWDPTC